jgi:hypothetical protein
MPLIEPVARRFGLRPMHDIQRAQRCPAGIQKQPKGVASQTCGSWMTCSDKARRSSKRLANRTAMSCGASVERVR